MTIGELTKKLPTLSEEERERELRALMPLLSPLTHQTLRDFQEKFFATHPVRPPFQVFREAQDKELLACLAMEVSDLGSAIRAKLNLAPLTKETEIHGS